jgi:hypothetical protein
LDSLQKYFKGAYVILANDRFIKRAEEATNYRLNIRYKKSLEVYLLGYYSRMKFQTRLKAIITIQSFFRMFKRKGLYQSLRKNVLKIQRNWRKYHYDK